MAGGESFNSSGTLNIDGTVNCGTGKLEHRRGHGMRGYRDRHRYRSIGDFSPSPVPVQPAPAPGTQCTGETATGCCPPLPSNGTITLYPGTYTCSLATGKGGLAILLEPGVYQLDGGLSVSGGNSVAMASDANGQGAVLYLPPLPLCVQTAGSCTDDITSGMVSGAFPISASPP